MSGNQSSAAFGVALVTALGIVCIGVFIAPWYAGEMPPVCGESYAFGFDNKRAVVCLVVAIGVLCGGGLLTEGIRTRSDRVFDWFVLAPITTGVSFAERAVLATGCIGMAASILCWDRVLVIPYWGEATYFLSRIDLVAMGQRPYVDFQYNYGPLLLYAPLLLDALSGHGLGIESAYAWTVVGMTLAGFWATWFFLRSLAIPSGFRPWALGLALVIWAPLTMGLNYAPLRFTFVPFALAACDRVVSGRASSGRSPLWATAAVAGLNALAFLISPEMGVACAAGLFAYFCFCGFSADRASALHGMIGIAIAVLSVAALSEGYFEGLRAFAGGANNFPIYPNLHNLLLVVTALCLLSALGVAILIHRGHPRAPFAAAVGAAATVLLAPALGRCDPGHIVLNELLLFFCVFPVMASMGDRWLWAWSGLYTVAFIIAMQISYWSLYASHYRQALDDYIHYGEQSEHVAAWRDAWEQRRRASDKISLPNWRRVAPYPTWADEIEEMRGRLALPLAGDICLDRYAKLAPGYLAPFYPVPIVEILTPSGVHRAVADSLRNDHIVLPKDVTETTLAGESLDMQFYARGISQFLSNLMLYPVDAAPRRPPFLPHMEVSRRLLDVCDIVGVGNDIVVLRPRSASAKSHDGPSPSHGESQNSEIR